MATSAPPRRGRPRRQETDDAILDAVEALVAGAGYDAVTIEAVARHAGVAKTTIYRRWTSRPQLVLAATARRTEDLPSADTGSLRSDLVALVREFIHRLVDTPFGLLVRAAQAAIAEEPALGSLATSSFVADRRRDLNVIVDRALARGELQPGIDRDLVFDLVVGAVFMRYLVMGLPLSDELAGQLVDAVLLGAPNLPPGAPAGTRPARPDQPV